MIDERDAQTRNLIASTQPTWTSLRLRKSHSLDTPDSSFSCSSVVFDDHHSFLCDVESQDFHDMHWDYFFFCCRHMPNAVLQNFEYVTLARKGGSSEFDRKLQWRFETPTLALTEGVEEFGQGQGEDRKSYTFRFYNGLLVSDPKGRGSVRLTASDMPDFIVKGEFTFGPEIV